MDPSKSHHDQTTDQKTQNTASHTSSTIKASPTDNISNSNLTFTSPLLDVTALRFSAEEMFNTSEHLDHSQLDQIVQMQNKLRERATAMEQTARISCTMGHSLGSLKLSSPSESEYESETSESDSGTENYEKSAHPLAADNVMHDSISTSTFRDKLMSPSKLQSFLFVQNFTPLDLTLQCAYYNFHTPITDTTPPASNFNVPSLFDLACFELVRMARLHRLPTDITTQLPSAALDRCLYFLSHPIPTLSPITDALVAPFLLPQLHYFSVSNSLETNHESGLINHLTGIGLDRALNCQNLTEFDLSDFEFEFSLEQLHSFGSFKCLHTLNLSRVQLLAPELELVELHTLTSLNLSWISCFRDLNSFPSALKLCSKNRHTLQYLHLDGLRANPNKVLTEVLTMCNSLSSLSMEGCGSEPGDKELEQGSNSATMVENESRLSQLIGELDDEKMIEKLEQTNDKLRLILVQRALRIKEKLELQQKIEAAKPCRADAIIESNQDVDEEKYTSREETDFGGTRLFVQFQRLNAVGCAQFNCETLADILPRCPNLTSLNLKAVYTVTSNLLDLLFAADTFTHLTELNLADVQAVSNATLQLISTHRTHLVNVDFSWCEEINNHGFISLLTGNYSQSESERSILKRCILSCNEYINSDSLSALGAHTDLREVDFSRCGSISGTEIIRFSRGWKHLTSINIAWLVTYDSDLLNLVQNCPMLQSISVEGCKTLTNQALINLSQCQSICIHLHYVSFAYVNDAQLNGIHAMLNNSHNSALRVVGYYGEVHDKTSLNKTSSG